MGSTANGEGSNIHEPWMHEINSLVMLPVFTRGCGGGDGVGRGWPAGFQRRECDACGWLVPGDVGKSVFKRISIRLVTYNYAS